MKPVFTLLTFLFVVVTGYSQQNRKLEKQVLKLFKESVRREAYAAYNEWSGHWEANNKDSVYFKSDTIVLTNRIGNDVFCRNVIWEFSGKNKFLFQQFNSCSEPSVAKPVVTEDFYTVEFIYEQDKLFITLNNNKGLKEVFQVLHTEALSEKRILTLVRSNKSK